MIFNKTDMPNAEKHPTIVDEEHVRVLVSALVGFVVNTANEPHSKHSDLEAMTIVSRLLLSSEAYRSLPHRTNNDVNEIMQEALDQINSVTTQFELKTTTETTTKTNGFRKEYEPMSNDQSSMVNELLQLAAKRLVEYDCQRNCKHYNDGDTPLECPRLYPRDNGTISCYGWEPRDEDSPHQCGTV